MSSRSTSISTKAIKPKPKKSREEEKKANDTSPINTTND